MRTLLFISSLLCLFGCCYSVFVSQPAFYATNSHWYQIIIPDSPVTYAQAVQDVNSRYLVNSLAYLVTVNDAGESQFLNNTYFKQPTYAAGLANPVTSWTGGVKIISSGLWFWYALNRMSASFWDTTKKTCNNGLYCNWATGEPSTAGTNNCSQVFFTGVPGTWRAVACNSVAPLYVIEYDPPSGKCPAGFTYTTNPYPQCVDINECAATPPKCGTGYTCVNTNGSYSCKDIDECAIVPSVCPDSQICNNTNGSYICQDIPYCSRVPAVCPFGTKCVPAAQNTPPYMCYLLPYFRIKSNIGDVVLDLENGNSAAGTRVIVDVLKTVNADSQLWRVTPEGYVQNKLMGYVLDIANDAVVSGTATIVWPRKDISVSQNQLWSWDVVVGTFVPQSATILSLDVNGGFDVPGTYVNIYWSKSMNDTKANQLFTPVY